VPAQTVGLNAMTTLARYRSQWGEVFLLTFHFIGLVRYADDSPGVGLKPSGQRARFPNASNLVQCVDRWLKRHFDLPISFAA
jgi:hypothetical protein